MKLKIKKSKVKGFTLIEVVVALAIFAIAATLLVQGALSVIYNVRCSRNLVKKVNYQSGIVANKNESMTQDIGPMDIKLEMTGVSQTITVDRHAAIIEVDADGNPKYQDFGGNLTYFD